jgi:excisionase family DNA binding protein
MVKRNSNNGTKWFTTSEAAKLCGLSHMTIIRRFDAGDIKGFKVPGSRFRRIPRESLVDFAARHGIPLPDLSGGSAAGAPAEGDGGAHVRRALVVEDERRMAELVEKVLVADGWEVRVARNGFDAGLLAATFRPQLVLLDIMLPGLDGRDACRQMKANPQLAGTKILAVTALKDEESIERIIEAGVDGYLAKPFSLEELRTRIAKLVPAAAAARGTAVKPVAETAD